MKRLLLLLAVLATGCGTTRVTDTSRTATEQLLVSHAVDQAVSQLDFRILAGKRVFFDPQHLEGTVDRGYLVSSLRQHLLASGCLLQEKRENADYVVEARAGAVGTDRHGILVGIPQMNLPTFVPGQPSQIPEIPFAKKTDQKGYAKIGVFAYNRNTGQPVFQSGIVQAVSSSKDFWLLGTGPFQKGTIRSEPQFAGQAIAIPFMGEATAKQPKAPVVEVTQPVIWNEPRPARPRPEVTSDDKAKRAIDVLAPAPKPAPPSAKDRAETEPAHIINSGFGFEPEG